MDRNERACRGLLVLVRGRGGVGGRVVGVGDGVGGVGQYERASRGLLVLVRGRGGGGGGAGEPDREAVGEAVGGHVAEAVGEAVGEAVREQAGEAVGGLDREAAGEAISPFSPFHLFIPCNRWVFSLLRPEVFNFFHLFKIGRAHV